MFYRQFNLLFQDIILVGCGGTGSRVVPPLVQTIKQAQAQLNPQLFLIDGDIFESKNLTRQNCIKRDLGRNKAVVLAERYSAALDFPIVACPMNVHIRSEGTHIRNQLDEYADNQQCRRTLSTPKLWVMCVDSISARLAILSHVGPDDVIIDAGNEDTFGQVSIFDPVSIPHMIGNGVECNIRPFSGEYELPIIPAPLIAYLDAVENPPVRTGSCADLDQSLAINNLMAAGIINMVQNLAYGNKFYCRTHFYDLIKGNSSERMTNTWFNQVMNETSELTHPVAERITQAFVPNYRKREYYPAPFNRHEFTTLLVDDINTKVQYIDPSILSALGK